jgi:hypothetical protein
VLRCRRRKRTIGSEEGFFLVAVLDERGNAGRLEVCWWSRLRRGVEVFPRKEGTALLRGMSLRRIDRTRRLGYKEDTE